ncbi:DUF885 domain-containing protein [Sinomicrobium kalidii]|uniref:DUF885 domain-containing protein n=1 Tax=Sinomicrobium kalidii TaxID=2900738 RepID=UPI003F5D55C3
MNRILLAFMTIVVLYGCKKERKSGTEDASQALQQVIDSYHNHKGYDKEQYPLGLYTKTYYEAEAQFARKKLGELSEINAAGLSETEQISLKLLAFSLQNKVDFFGFERYLNPITSHTGFHSSLPYRVKPLTNYKQVRRYLNQLNAIPGFVDQHIENMREGLQKGISQPRVIFDGYESTYNDHIVSDYEESFYYSPFKDLPKTLTGAQKDSVLKAAKTAIEIKVVPQFKRIKDFFETEYIPNTRTTLGISGIPNGKAYYQNRISFYTTSSRYTADDIHNIGLQEVARIRAEMETIIAGLDFKGSFKDFLRFLRTDEQFYAKTPGQLLMLARDIAKRADAQLPRFFKTLSRKPYGVAPVPDAMAPKYTGGRYIPTPSESTDPGYYWVNTYDLPSRTLYTLPVLTAHEAVPGHHLQISLNRELGDSIPGFRRNFSVTAFVEGWGLYAETLGAEMGLYTTPYEQFGKLTYEMWRACRLVVDTGIHAKGWTREQVVDYMASNTALSLLEINSETDRYISNPGQALSYKIGELKIRELRKKAEQQLGTKFDIRTFHEVVLEQGTVTLPILEQRVNNYIRSLQ